MTRRRALWVCVHSLLQDKQPSMFVELSKQWAIHRRADVFGRRRMLLPTSRQHHSFRQSSSSTASATGETSLKLWCYCKRMANTDLGWLLARVFSSGGSTHHNTASIGNSRRARPRPPRFLLKLVVKHEDLGLHTGSCCTCASTFRYFLAFHDREALRMNILACKASAQPMVISLTR
jgi:hypothetical protein